MALPRVFDVTLMRKQTMNDGRVLMAFRINESNDSIRGYMRVIAVQSVADDFAVGSEFDGTFAAE